MALIPGLDLRHSYYDWKVYLESSFNSSHLSVDRSLLLLFGSRWSDSVPELEPKTELLPDHERMRLDWALMSIDLIDVF